MITLTAANDLTIESLKQAIEAHMKHSYIEKYIEKPVVDDDKLIILASIIQHSNVPIHKQRNYIITAMLVQIALDTHDLVTRTDSSEESDESRKTRQLTVLAGDYYSGLYYYLLSKLEDISMIRTLASAIKEINEHKMNTYYKEFNHTQQFIESWKQMESLLIQRIAQHVNQPFIIDFAKDWLFVRRLVREKDLFFSMESTPLIELLTKRSSYQMNDREISQCIKAHEQSVLAAISQFPKSMDLLRAYVNDKIDFDVNKKKMVAEEG